LERIFHPPSTTTAMSTALFRRAHSQLFLPATRAFGTLPSLPLNPPSPSDEQAQFKVRLEETQAFFDQPRFAGLKRPYTAEDVASKQGSLPVLPLPSTLLADKLWRLFDARAKEGKPVHTMGAIDPAQMTQMAPHQEVVYISGWACSSLLTTASNEVGPDIGYLINSV
jgi:isocitrate lyase